MRPRSDGLTLAQRRSSKARLAAATAISTSFLSASGTLAMTAPVAGLREGLAGHSRNELAVDQHQRRLPEKPCRVA
jgi:hypothetical protein